MFVAEMPAVPGAALRPAEKVSPEELKNLGVNISAAQINSGDVVEFDTADPVVMKQEFRSGIYAYYVAAYKVKGDRKIPTWISIGSLTRRDGHNKPLDAVRAELSSLPSFREVYDFLKGKKLKGLEAKEYEFAVFEDNVRKEGEFTKRYVAPLEYVD